MSSSSVSSLPPTSTSSLPAPQPDHRFNVYLIKCSENCLYCCQLNPDTVFHYILSLDLFCSLLASLGFCIIITDHTSKVSEIGLLGFLLSSNFILTNIRLALTFKKKHRNDLETDVKYYRKCRIFFYAFLCVMT
jgi:hypothetical protein